MRDQPLNFLETNPPASQETANAFLSPEAVLSGQRLRLIRAKRVEKKNLESKIHAGLALTFCCGMGIVYLGILGNAAFCIPIIFLIISLYYAAELHHKDQEIERLTRRP
jgi:hypothetical protein